MFAPATEYRIMVDFWPTVLGLTGHRKFKTAIAARWSFFLLLLPGDATVISEASSGNV